MNKLFNPLRSRAAKLSALAGVALMSAAAQAQTTSGVDTILDAVDFTSVTAKVIAAGVVVIGIAMAFKGIDLGKRTTKKA